MLRLRSYERLLVENRRICSNGGRLTQNFTYRRRLPPNHSSSQKTRLNDLSYDIIIWTNLSFILSQITRLTDRQTDRQREMDRQTDRQTEFSSLDRVCIPCSAVKTLHDPRVCKISPISPVGKEKVYRENDLPRSQVLSSE